MVRRRLASARCCRPIAFLASSLLASGLASRKSQLSKIRANYKGRCSELNLEKY